MTRGDDPAPAAATGAVDRSADGVKRRQQADGQTRAANSRHPDPLRLARRGLRLELRRALRHERVALADERAVRELPGHDHLAPDPERIRHDPGVDDGNHRTTPVAVADAEAKRVARPLDGAGGDLAGQVNRTL